MISSLSSAVKALFGILCASVVLLCGVRTQIQRHSLIITKIRIALDAMTPSTVSAIVSVLTASNCVESANIKLCELDTGAARRLATPAEDGGDIGGCWGGE